MAQENKKEEKPLTGLTDFDIFELYIDCVEIFVESCSRNDLEEKRCFEFGQSLWEKTIEARDKYRKSNPTISRGT